MRIAALVSGGIAAIAAAALAAVKVFTDRYVDPGQAAVEAAGFAAKTTQVNDVRLSYVEGPENGPPLVLLHAQHLDWFSYHRVLPTLSRSFHVFAVDCPGHGDTTYPDDYVMTADRIGADLGDFMAAAIGEPAFVSGNSSGGLLTAWLAANRPELVRAILLEDPPLFSAEQPRIRQTIAYRSFTTSHHAVQEKAGDFLLYWIAGNAAFFRKNVGRGADVALTQLVKSYRRANPGAPVAIGLIRNPTVREFVRGLDKYDPRFGAAFYDGTWNFDHAETLRRIACPALLLHARFETRADGTLHGAMNQDEADRAAALLRHGRYVRTDAAHVVHLDRPGQFTDLVEGFFLRQLRF